MTQCARFPEWLFLGIALISSVLEQQIARFEVSGENLRIEDRMGKVHQVNAPGIDAQSIRISPDGKRLVFHKTFAGYWPNRDLEVRVWSASRPETLEEFTVSTYSRFIDIAQWIDNRHILFAGDGYGVVADVESRTRTHDLGQGAGFLTSPDRQCVVFQRIHKRAPSPEVVSDVALIALIGQKRAAGEGVVEVNSLTPGIFEIYPSPADTTRGVPPPSPRQRHQFLSDFLWSADSRRISFVEWQDGSVWLVTVTLDFGPKKLSARHERWLLPVVLRDEQLSSFGFRLEGFRWRRQDQEAQFIVNGVRLIADLTRRAAFLEAHP